MREKDIPFGSIPPGWTAEAWIRRLRALAEACAKDSPEESERYREWIGALEDDWEDA